MPTGQFITLDMSVFCAWPTGRYQIPSGYKTVISMGFLYEVVACLKTMYQSE